MLRLRSSQTVEDALGAESWICHLKLRAISCFEQEPREPKAKGCRRRGEVLELLVIVAARIFRFGVLAFQNIQHTTQDLGVKDFGAQVF